MPDDRPVLPAAEVDAVGLHREFIQVLKDAPPPEQTAGVGRDLYAGPDLDAIPS